MRHSRGIADAAVQADSESADGRDCPSGSHAMEACSGVTDAEKQSRALVAPHRSGVRTEVTSEELGAAQLTASTGVLDANAVVAAGSNATSADSRHMSNAHDVELEEPVALAPPAGDHLTGVALDVALELVESSGAHSEGQAAGFVPLPDSPPPADEAIEKQSEKACVDVPLIVGAAVMGGLPEVTGEPDAVSAESSLAAYMSLGSEHVAAEQLQRTSQSDSAQSASLKSDQGAEEQLQGGSLLSAEAHLEELAAIAAQLQQAR